MLGIHLPILRDEYPQWSVPLDFHADSRNTSHIIRLISPYDVVDPYGTFNTLKEII
jgi:hypothetical protein